MGDRTRKLAIAALGLLLITTALCLSGSPSQVKSHRRMPEKFQIPLEITDPVWIYDDPAFSFSSAKIAGTKTWKEGFLYGSQRQFRGKKCYHAAFTNCTSFIWHESAIERRVPENPPINQPTHW